jgi:hypothetical protein
MSDKEPIVPITIRLPESLHAAIKALSAEHMRSLNSEIVKLLSEAIASREKV